MKNLAFTNTLVVLIFARCLNAHTMNQKQKAKSGLRKKVLTMPNDTVCRKCCLRHSSYCLGCSNVKHGLNLTNEEYLKLLKMQVERSADNAE